MSNAKLLDQPGSRVIELDIEGMTCASCVGRVERKLGKLDGVQASVNLPLESARVTVPANITDEQIAATVNAAGYKATVGLRRRLAAAAEGPPHGHGGDAEAPADRRGRPHRPGLCALHGPGRPVPELGLGCRRPGVAGGQLGGVAVPPGRGGECPASVVHHGHAGVDRRDGRLCLLRLAAPGRSPPHRTPGHGGHGIRPACTSRSPPSSPPSCCSAATWRPTPSARPATRSRPCWTWAPRMPPCCATARSSRSRGPAPGRGRRRRPPRREDRHRRRGHRGHLRRRRLPVTGESVPVEVGPDSPVTGATINTSGRILVRATRVGADTTLAQMGRLVSQAQSGKAPIARLADRISAVFVPVVLAIAALTFGAWLLAAGPASATPSSAPPSPPPSRCWSSPARAPWAWPPRSAC